MCPIYIVHKTFKSLSNKDQVYDKNCSFTGNNNKKKLDSTPGHLGQVWTDTLLGFGILKRRTSVWTQQFVCTKLKQKSFFFQNQSKI